MAWTQADIDALEVAYKSGATKVRFRDRETEFRSLAEMRSLLDEARRNIARVKRTPHVASSYDRGYQ